MQRRELLATMGLAGVSGCLRLQDAESTGTATGTPTGTPSRTDRRETADQRSTAGDEETDRDPTDLSPVHVLTDYSNETWQATWEEELIPAFRDESGIGIEMEFPGTSGQHRSRLDALVRAGDPPDVFTSTFHELIGLWADDRIEPATDLVGDIASVAGDLVVEPYRDRSGDIYQVPHGYFAVNFQYRQDVYDALGLSAPASFRDVLDNARAIDESDLDIRGYGLSATEQSKSQDEFQVYLANMGVPPHGLRWADPDARDEVEIHFPEAEVTTLLQWFKDLSQYSPEPTSIGWVESIENYLGGQFAQQFHLNVWIQGIAAGAGVDHIVENTGIAPLPRWEEGGVSRDDVWLYKPAPDGHHVFAGGGNTPGAREWLQWLYGGSVERTATMYSAEPARFLPAYGDVLESDAFTSMQIWQDYPTLLDDLRYCRNTIVADYYGNVPESDVFSPESIRVSNQWFYGQMLNSVISGDLSVQEAYRWGYDRLETHLQDAQVALEY